MKRYEQDKSKGAAAQEGSSGRGGRPSSSEGFVRWAESPRSTLSLGGRTPGVVSAVDCFSRGSRSVPAESLAGGGYCEDAEMAAGAPVRASGAATTVVQPPAGVALHASIEEELEVVEVRVTG